jgi:hypothetical protein
MSKTCTDEEMHSRYRKMRVNGKEVNVHRFVMEQILGRPLDKLEFVHHINGNRYDNRPENLQLVTPKEHVSVHDQSYRQTPEFLKGFRGQKHTPEWKAAASARMRGNQHNKGRSLTPEHKANISEGLRRHYASSKQD